MIELLSHGVLARDEDIINLVIFVIIMAFGMIANMVKARSEKSHKSRQQKSEDTPQEERITSSQDKGTVPSRLEQILGTITKPADSETSKENAPSQQRRRRYTPGGFAEVLRQDQAMEETLTSSQPKKAELHLADVGLQSPFKPFHELEEMDDFLDMGRLDISAEITGDTPQLTAASLTVNLDSLPEAILYCEILAKPIALRGNDNTF